MIVFSATNRFRTVRSFRLNGWGVSYNGKGRSVFVSFRKNDTITLYCHILYVCVACIVLWYTVCAFSLVLAMDVNMDVCLCCVRYLTQVTYVFMRNCRVDFPQNTARYIADFQ